MTSHAVPRHDDAVRQLPVQSAAGRGVREEVSANQQPPSGVPHPARRRLLPEQDHVPTSDTSEITCLVGI